MKKRGPKPLPPELRRSYKLTVWVRPDVAEGMFAAMSYHGSELSEWAAGQFERWVARERELIASQINSKP